MKRPISLSICILGIGLYLMSSGHAAIIVVSDLNTATSGPGATSELVTTDPYRYDFPDLDATLSATDLAQSATFSQVMGSPHGVSGPITALNDGRGGSNNNDLPANYFSDTVSRFLIDLGQSSQILQFNSYSYSGSTRTKQRYDLYGSLTLGSPESNLTGYTLIENVDTTSPAVGGQHLVSIRDNGGASIGTYRYLVMDMPNFSVGGDGGTLFS